jgi:(p)ppGpp synthase/HD superfamily hydrolase
LLELVELATATALRYHHGQVNKHDGEPYVLHVHRVALSVSHDVSLSPVHQAIAWLHDTLEDTALTYGDLAKLMSPYGDAGFRVLRGVEALTKVKGVSNEDYYYSLIPVPDAAAVKLHDLFDNFGRTHTITDPATAARLSKKYSLGIDILKRMA